LGSVERADPTIRSVADASGVLTLAIDYRLAPEHPFPAAVDDSWAALEWLATHAAEHGADADRLAVAGDSAGANLAAVMCLLARERGGPRIGFQGLVYPLTTFAFDTPSYLANAKGHFLTGALVQRFVDWYLPADQRGDWRAAPSAADDLSGLPSALVITAEYDPLRDDAAAYARRLRAAGGVVEHLDVAGMIHGFFSMPALVPQATDAQQALARAMRAAVT
jgi:acetyl esterase